MISVIIPTYNRPDRLVRCVRSIFRQTHLPDEVVIVDDASSVKYEQAMEKIERGAPQPHEALNVRYVRNEEGGGANVARNTGAALARGDVLMFIDDDDSWQPTKVEGQIRLLDQDPDVGIVYSGRRVVTEAGEVLYCIAPQHEGWLHRLLLQRNCIGTTSGVAIRQSVFEQAGGFDEDLPALQDYDLWIRTSRYAAVAYDSEFTVNWTVHAEAGKQMAGDPDIYVQAHDSLEQKYESAIAALSKGERRRRHANRCSSIAGKCARSGRIAQQYAYAFRSICAMPTFSGLSRLIPYPLWVRLRKTLRSNC